MFTDARGRLTIFEQRRVIVFLLHGHQRQVVSREAAVILPC